MTENQPILTIDEAAELLQLSTRTLERYCAESLIPHIRLPRRGRTGPIRFMRAQLNQWLQQYSVKPGRYTSMRSRLR